jgi:regulatory protein
MRCPCHASQTPPPRPVSPMAAQWHVPMMRQEPPPNEEALHEAALAYLARYAATRATLLRALTRRVDRWARGAEGPDVPAQAAAARAAARTVVARLAAAGLVDDAAFAAARARRLRRTGRSRRAAAAHLAARGVDTETLAAALPEDVEEELAAAVAFARRRRLGPFRGGQSTPEIARRELAALARAGFPGAIARAVLALAPAEAEAMLARLRQG